jgi:hypothetical protein
MAMNTITCEDCGARVVRAHAHIRSICFVHVGWCQQCWTIRTTPAPGPRQRRAGCPEQVDVDALRELLDLLDGFRDNDQRARYLLSCNWMRDRGAVAAARLGADAGERDGRPRVMVGA